MKRILVVMVLVLSALIVSASNNESIFSLGNITSNIVVSESSKYHIEIDCQYLMDNPNLNYRKIDLYTDFCKVIFPNITQSEIKCNFEFGDIVREESQFGNRFDGGIVINRYYNHIDKECDYDIVSFSQFYLSDSQLTNHTMYPHHLDLDEEKPAWSKGDWDIMKIR